MANVKLSSYLKSISGKIGNIVYYNRYNMEYARVHVIPSNPDTAAQRFVRHTFSDAVKSWQLLSEYEKEAYNMKARRLPLSGYNLYISQYMKQNISLHGKMDLPASAGVRITTGKHTHSTTKASLSVPPPFMLRRSSCNTVIHSTSG